MTLWKLIEERGINSEIHVTRLPFKCLKCFKLKYLIVLQKLVLKQSVSYLINQKMFQIFS